MILTGDEILRCIQVEQSISIEPFNPSRVGANSYDVQLSPQLLRVHNTDPDTGLPKPLDVKKPYRFEEIIIPEEGVVLDPAEFYLGSTIEQTCSPQHIPMYEGRSTMARYGLVSHLSAGFGDIGFKGRWTLEIRCALPLRIYPCMRIGQIYFVRPVGEISQTYGGRYSNRLSAAVAAHGNI